MTRRPPTSPPFPSPPLSRSEPAALPREVVSLLESRCAKCHGGDRPKANLNLATADGIGRGGKRGPVVAPGKPDQSLLWQVVRSEEHTSELQSLAYLVCRLLL